jgi:hypothetical protein
LAFFGSSAAFFWILCWLLHVQTSATERGWAGGRAMESGKEGERKGGRSAERRGKAE